MKPLCDGAWAVPASPVMKDKGNHYFTCSLCGEPTPEPTQGARQNATPYAIEDNELQEQINKYGAYPNDLYGVLESLYENGKSRFTPSMAFDEIEQLINAHTTRKEAQARLDELKPVAFRVKDSLAVRSAPRSFVRFHLTDEFIDKRIAELEQALNETKEEA